MLGNDMQKGGVNNKYLVVLSNKFAPYLAGGFRQKYIMLWQIDLTDYSAKDSHLGRLDHPILTPTMCGQNALPDTL